MGRVEVKGAAGEISPDGKFIPKDSQKLVYDSKVHGKTKEAPAKKDDDLVV